MDRAMDPFAAPRACDHGQTLTRKAGDDAAGVPSVTQHMCSDDKRKRPAASQLKGKRLGLEQARNPTVVMALELV